MLTRAVPPPRLAGVSTHVLRVLAPVRARLRRRRRLARRWLLRARLDFSDWRSGGRDPLVPPRRLGLPSQIVALGERLVELLREHAELDRDAVVLDIGCGPGRTAAALTRVLSPSARYEGFDVMPQSIRWCRKAIEPRYPNFHFQVADIFNREYNPTGRQRAMEYEFPYPAGTFDLAVAASLFTHLPPCESERYLAETARTLRPGGRLLGTWFLLNSDSERALSDGVAQPPGLLAEQRPALRLEHRLSDERGNPYRSVNAEVPELMIAVPESDVIALHERAGLSVLAVLAGRWCGADGPIGQDVIVAERRTGA